MQESNKAIAGSRPESSRVVRVLCFSVGHRSAACNLNRQSGLNIPQNCDTASPLGPSKATRRAISVTWRALGFGTSSKGSRALDATLSCRRSAWGRVAINSFLSDKLMGRIKNMMGFEKHVPHYLMVTTWRLATIWTHSYTFLLWCTGWCLPREKEMPALFVYLELMGWEAPSEGGDNLRPRERESERERERWMMRYNDLHIFNILI